MGAPRPILEKGHLKLASEICMCHFPRHMGIKRESQAANTPPPEHNFYLDGGLSQYAVHGDFQHIKAD